ncbi:MAG: hypothetical protein JW864_06115 [Spirochaetes bacterium]|nr:hypothetical protein [Spirochaetota bacterium]
MKLKLFIIVAILAVAMMGIYTPEAKAQGASVTPYANILLWAGYTSKSEEASWKVDDTGAAEEDADVFMAVTPQGSLGVRGSANNVMGDVSFMVRTPSMDSDQQSQALLFTAYVMYNVNDFGLLVGRFFAPYDKVDFGNIACQTTAFGWDMFLGYTLFDATRDQIKVSYKGAYLALLKNTKNEDSDWDVVLPMVAVGYQYGSFMTPFNFGVHALYQTAKDDAASWVTDEDTNLDGNIDPTDYYVATTGAYGESLTAWAVAGDFGVKMDPIEINGHVHYGVNTADMGVQGGGAAIVNGSYEDTTTLAGWVSVGYTMGAAKLYAGLGYRSVDNSETYVEADTAMTYYVSCAYSIQPNFSVTPIVHYEDKMKGSADQEEGNVLTVGALFKASI